MRESVREPLRAAVSVILIQLCSGVTGWDGLMNQDKSVVPNLHLFRFHCTGAQISFTHMEISSTFMGKKDVWEWIRSNAAVIRRNMLVVVWTSDCISWNCMKILAKRRVHLLTDANLTDKYTPCNESNKWMQGKDHEVLRCCSCTKWDVDWKNV